MKINAMFYKDPDYLKGEPVMIGEVVTLSERRFEAVVNQPFANWPWLGKYYHHMWQEDDVHHCLLVLGEHTNDGILIQCQSKEIDNAAHFPGAKQYLQVAIQQLAQDIVDRAVNSGQLCQNVDYEQLEEFSSLELLSRTQLTDEVTAAIMRHKLVKDFALSGDCYSIQIDPTLADGPAAEQAQSHTLS